ncbi:biotin-dependent carboxyltransferase family protein [Virgibacillus xinjiangensis]|uniref:Biotin-dependent carboxyltransferase family protein n=1 Tax=Virgibacillus xinjiangensis TaxID=393090 RepID=A0ABV7CZ05_9BACI
MQSREIFKVVKPGMYTTFQDLGRTGFQRYGVPPGGAMDPFALQIANILAGNPPGTAALEVTLLGPELIACTDITIVITGADLGAQLNGRPTEMWSTRRMKEGDRLSFGKYRSGSRAYIAVSGGFDAPEYLGSSSVDGNIGIGSLLKKMDKLNGYPQPREQGIGLARKHIPVYGNSIRTAVIEGPHTEAFTSAGRETFFHTIHRVEANSNRMGYRLRSEQIKVREDAEIWSDAVPFGGIQVPGNGQPIILMADRQTTGGYPRIGTITSADIPNVAQLAPGGEISFYSISVEDAQERLRRMREFLHELYLFSQYI